MVHAPAPPAFEAKGSAYQVERPRVSDAVGSALQKAYAGDRNLPQEMIDLLRRLSSRGQRTH